MSNVRRHKSIERQLRVKLEVQQLQCNRSALERSAPRRVELASGEIHGQPSWQTGFKVPHAAVFTGRAVAHRRSHTKFVQAARLASWRAAHPSSGLDEQKL